MTLYMDKVLLSTIKTRLTLGLSLKGNVMDKVKKPMQMETHTKAVSWTMKGRDSAWWSTKTAISTKGLGLQMSVMDPVNTLSLIKSFSSPPLLMEKYKERAPQHTLTVANWNQSGKTTSNNDHLAIKYDIEILTPRSSLCHGYRVTLEILSRISNEANQHEGYCTQSKT